MEQPHFEFDHKQNAELEELSGKSRIAAIAIGLLVVLDVISQFSSAEPSSGLASLLAIASFLAGAYSCYALLCSSQRLSKATQTNGEDLRHLFSSLQYFENCFIGLALAIFFHLSIHFVSNQ
jgi:hypothetical protein